MCKITVQKLKSQEEKKNYRTKYKLLKGKLPNVVNRPIINANNLNCIFLIQVK